MNAPRIPRNSALFVQRADLEGRAQADGRAVEELWRAERRASLPPAQHMTPAECSTEVGANQPPRVIRAAWLLTPREWLAVWLALTVFQGVFALLLVYHRDLWRWLVALLAGL